jgi:hypothetical protein
VAETKRPLRVVATHDNKYDAWRLRRKTYTFPWSVVGGAPKSGFSVAISVLFGPIIEAPSGGRMGWVPFIKPFGSRLIVPSVAEGGGGAELLDPGIDGADLLAAGAAVAGPVKRRTHTTK